jgi:hypothetical protein
MNTTDDPYGSPSVTLVGMPETRLPARPIRAQMITLAARGAAGATLDAHSVTQVCAALLPALVAAEAAEVRARKAERSLRAESLGAKLLEDALRAARVTIATLRRQLEGGIQRFTLAGLQVDAIDAASDFDELTVRREPSVELMGRGARPENAGSR